VRTAPAAAGFPQAEEVWLNPADGERVIAWHAPPARRQPGRRLFPRQWWFATPAPSIAFKSLRPRGSGLIALSYRGLWRFVRQADRGRPHRGLRAPAYDFAAERYAGRIALWGESLGTGVAVALAAEKPVAPA